MAAIVGATECEVVVLMSNNTICEPLGDEGSAMHLSVADQRYCCLVSQGL